ncbi:MAG: repeat-like domain [Acidimicrobiaceae bacterium]|jgi:hypothetical protein|nr:repeat-like domain [Acidimicrobiaceae bacterium]
MHLRRLRRLAVGAVALLAWSLVDTTPVHAAETLSPAAPTFGYDAGPFTNVNVGGLLIGSCTLPAGCDDHPFSVNIPAGYYQALRDQGKVGVVEVTATWASNENDFDLGLLDKDGNPIATSGFGNSDFERFVFTELPTGNYTIEMAVFRAVNESFHIQVALKAMDPGATAASAADGGMRFSNGTPVALERSSGEPNVEIAPNNDIYVDMPLGAGSNSILYKSTDNGDTFKPLAPYHPNNNPLPNNALGGGDSYTAIDKDGRVCFSELNTLLSLGIGCSTDGGKTFVPADPLIIDPATPLVDRQWQAATPQGEQFIAAEFGVVTVGLSQPGIRLFKETVKGSNAFTQVADIDSGKSMKSYNMVADPTDTDADGGTIIEAYLRSNQGPDKTANPHELMVWSSTDGGTTITTHKVAALPTTPGNNFASVAVDSAGNVYVAWSEQGTWDIYYSVAKKGALDTWSAPVRVNLEPEARTAIQPTIRVGDPGRVFVGFYAAPQFGNPDALPGGQWNAFMAYSTDGACQIDATPCARPTFHQTRISDHVVQDRGICLGGTGCGGDPYYGDRSMLEFLDIAFSPKTGQAHVITTDSSRTNTGTTITMYRQTAGPSAFASAGPVEGVTRTGDPVGDPAGDAGWPYESPVPSQATPGADITSVSLTRPDSATLRVTMKVVDVSKLTQAVQSGLGRQLLIATRFTTAQDVFWVGLRVNLDGTQAAAGGHLVANGLVDAYISDTDVTPKATVDAAANSIVLDVPMAQLKTTLQQPATVTTAAPVVQGVNNGDPLYGVTGFSLVGLNSSSDPLAKHWLDVAPAFNVSAAVNTSNVPPGGGTANSASGGSGQLPATGTDQAPAADAALAVLLAALALAGLRRRARATQP